MTEPVSNNTIKKISLTYYPYSIDRPKQTDVSPTSQMTHETYCETYSVTK